MSEIKSSIKTAQKYFEKKEFEKSIRTLQDIIKNNGNILEKEEYNTDLGEINSLLAKSSLALKRLDESLKYADVCLQLAVNSKNFPLQAQALRILGSVHSQKGNHIKSLELLRKSLQLEQKIGDKIGEAYSLFELGIEEADGEEFNESTEHLRHAIKIFNILNRQKEAKRAERELNIILEEMNEEKFLEDKVPKKFRDEKEYL